MASMPWSSVLLSVVVWLAVRLLALARLFPLVVDRGMIAFRFRGFRLAGETSCPAGGDSIRITSSAGLMADSGLSSAQTYCR